MRYDSKYETTVMLDMPEPGWNNTVEGLIIHLNIRNTEDAEWEHNIRYYRPKLHKLLPGTREPSGIG